MVKTKGQTGEGHFVAAGFGTNLVSQTATTPKEEFLPLFDRSGFFPTGPSLSAKENSFVLLSPVPVVNNPQGATIVAAS